MTTLDSDSDASAQDLQNAGQAEAAPHHVPRALVFSDTGETVMFACGSCGNCYSTAIYACSRDRAAQVAYRAADECCAPRHCACGAQIEKQWTACASCRLRSKLQRASVVTDYSGPVFADGYCGGWGDGYFADVEELIEACATYDVAPPAFCNPCKPLPLALDAESILERACEDQHEDAMDQIVGADALIAAIEAFNSAQTCVSYWPEYSQVIVMDQAGFDALRADPAAVAATSAQQDQP